jgi:hypothetical protein
MTRIGSAIPENSCFTPSGPDLKQIGPDAIRVETGEIEIGGRRYIRQQRLARILKVTPRTLARWNARGIGPPKITIGKTVLFDVAKVPDWLASRESQPIRHHRR